MTELPTIRVAKYRADMALELLPAARDCQDAAVIDACVRIRNAWLLGGRVTRADLALVETFAGEV